MKKIIGICLGLVSLTSATPVVAQGFYMRNVVKNIGKLAEETQKGLKGSINIFKKQFVTELAPASRVAQVERWAAINLDEPVRATLSWPETTDLFSDAKRFIPKEDVKKILSGEGQTPYMYGTKGQDEFYLTELPEQILEEKFLPSDVQMRGAILYYRNRLLALRNEPFSLRNWGKSMAIITDLGLFGDAQDARAIVQTAGDFHGELAGISDLIAARALINIGRTEDISTLAQMRLLERTPEGKSVKLAAQWRDIKAYMDQTNFTLELDVERKVAEKPVTLSEDMARLLQQYNPYNLLQEDASVATTDFWLDLRQGVDAIRSCPQSSRQLVENLNAFTSISQAFNRITLDELQQFVETNKRKPRVSYGKGPRDESTLATRVQNILNNYDSNSPEVQAINQIYRNLEREQALLQENIDNRERDILSALETPEQIFNRFSAFRNENNRNPHRKLKADLPNLSQQELEEHWLAIRISEILSTGDRHDALIRGIRTMRKTPPNKTKPEPKEQPQEELFFNFARLTRELSDYIAENFRRPRGNITERLRNLSVLEKAEKKLYQRITTALREGDPSNPGYQTLIELWESTSGRTNITSQQLKQKVEQFIEKNEGQWPRLKIYRKGILIAPQNYTIQEAKEAELAKMISATWRNRPQDDPFNVWLRKSRTWVLYQ
ncbi:MAG: hypothetical protein J6V32_02630 [Elusimicrobiaceae bacterium]|nr:hypothetical protein [Elusimicrobiaceae bacterium]